jgi:hypothetical protein
VTRGGPACDSGCDYRIYHTRPCSCGAYPPREDELAGTPPATEEKGEDMALTKASLEGRGAITEGEIPAELLGHQGEDRGGKPNPGTSKDGRLAKNKGKKGTGKK